MSALTWEEVEGKAADDLWGGLSPTGRAAVTYARNNLAVIPLKPRDKVPLTEHGRDNWSLDTNAIAQYWAVNPTANVGIVTGEPSKGVVVIDVDVHGNRANGLESLAEWEVSSGRKLPETVTFRTGSGGRHLLYRVKGKPRNSTNGSLGIDVRGDGGYIVAPPSIHPNGDSYTELVSLDDMDIAQADDAVYEFLDYVRSPERPSSGQSQYSRFELPEVIGEGGRNDTLYKYACSMRTRGYEQGAIRQGLEEANSRCNPPMTSRELDRIAESACQNPAGYSAEVLDFKAKQSNQGKDESSSPQNSPRSQPWLSSKGAFHHNVLARHLMDEYHVCYMEGMPAIWVDDHYEVGEDAIKRVMIELCDTIKEQQRREVMRYLSLKLKGKSRPQADPKYIQFKNGVLNIETAEMQEPSPDLLIPNVIPHNWNPDASCNDLDKAIDAWACGDHEIISQLWEIFGMGMYRGRKAMGDCPVLIGSGSNGKSTLLNLLHKVLGEENVSTLDLADLGKRFQSVSMMGKLANIGDDIANEFITGSDFSIVKKAITGDWIGAEYKGGDTFQYRPYATQIFSCNEMPRFGDSTEGVFRRFKPVPLLAKFDSMDGTKDINLEERLSSEESCEYACLMGVTFLSLLLQRGGMTVSAKGSSRLSEIRRDNSTVIQYMEDVRGYGTNDVNSIEGTPTSEIYKEYKDYCEKSGIKQLSRNKFTREVCRVYAQQTKDARVNYATGSTVKKVFLGESQN